MNAGTMTGIDPYHLAKLLTGADISEMPYCDFLALERGIAKSMSSPFGRPSG